MHQKEVPFEPRSQNGIKPYVEDQLGSNTFCACSCKVAPASSYIGSTKLWISSCCSEFVDGVPDAS